LPFREPCYGDRRAAIEKRRSARTAFLFLSPSTSSRADPGWAPQKRISQQRSIQLVQRICPDGDDASAVLPPEQRLGTKDQPGTAGFTNRIDRCQSGDQDDKPPLAAGRFEHPRRDGGFA
jgi:hypothetical protein